MKLPVLFSLAMLLGTAGCHHASRPSVPYFSTRVGWSQTPPDVPRTGPEPRMLTAVDPQFPFDDLVPGMEIVFVRRWWEPPVSHDVIEHRGRYVITQGRGNDRPDEPVKRHHYLGRVTELAPVK